MAEAAHRRPPVVLIIDDQEWSTRSLESILAPNGFAVMRAYTAKKGLDRARTHAPDAIIVDSDLPDGDGAKVCSALRQDHVVSDHIPILISSAERPTRQQRLDAFRSGAWDVISYPVDAEELVLKLNGYVRAKFEADRMHDTSLVDPATGLYNLRGLERKAEELSAWAYRERAALACVVFAPAVATDDAESAISNVVQELAKSLRAAGRTSDAIGRLGNTEFAIVAPSTDAEGAVRMAQRISQAIRDNGGQASHIDLRAGYDAVTDVRETPATAKDLLMHATVALRRSRSEGNGWIRAFEARSSVPRAATT